MLARSFLITESLTFHLPQARLLLEDPGCGAEILGAWGALLPATLDRFGARLPLLQAFLEGLRTGLYVKDRVRRRPPASRVSLGLG